MKVIFCREVQALENPKAKLVRFRSGEPAPHRYRFAHEIPPSVLLSRPWPRKPEYHRLPCPSPRHVGLEGRERLCPCAHPHVIRAHRQNRPKARLVQAQCPCVELVAQSLYQKPVRFRAVVLRSCVVPVAVVLGSTAEVGRVCVGCSHGCRGVEHVSQPDASP